ncbi:MAG TPA: S1 RNA-binding domain-containing protein, partial [Candidatus Ignatzschineria merdigallinarum]|nr:S1 RNA-binding domain-containing protein [Candidatus Ignatzschineria merdigallinarum]
MSLSFAELFEQSIAEEQAREIGGIIKATVVKIENGFVIVDAGLKSEGRIPADQFQDLNGELEVQVGDKVDVVLESLEDGFGETRLSREKAKRAEVWAFLEKKLENDEIIKGIISGRVKGGFTVDIGTERAFLPGSLVDVRPVRDIAYLEGKELELKVIKLDQKRNNIVVSRRAVLEEEYSAEREELLKTLEEGDVVKGIVKNLTDYGAFIDLGGIDGLLHITDMAWKRVRHPS